MVEKLSSPVQEMLEKLFQNLLENEAMMSNAKLNSILASIKSSKNSSGKLCSTNNTVLSICFHEFS